MIDEYGCGSTSKSGTLAYCSPEQLRGGFQTQNSDMWSIGCIFYQMLTGRIPFKGKTVEKLIEKQKRKIQITEFGPLVSM